MASLSFGYQDRAAVAALYQSGIAVNPKPACPLIGQDGNIFNLTGIASKTLKENGLSVLAYEMTARVYGSGSYNEAIGLIGEYVNITSVDDPHENFEMEELR